MIPLQQLLEERSLVPSDVLAAASGRQKIYGGTLDTVLLETGALKPTQVDSLLAESTGLPPAPTALIHPPRDRPQDALPAPWSEAGTAFVLDRCADGLRIAVGPDVDDGTLDRLRNEVPDAVPMVTAECCMAMLRAERSGTVVPQRYGMLGFDYVKAVATEPAAQSTPAPPDPVPPPPVAEPPAASHPEAAAVAPASDPDPDPDPAAPSGDPLAPPIPAPGELPGLPRAGGDIPGLPTPGATGGSSIMQRALAMLDGGPAADDEGTSSDLGLPPPPPAMGADSELAPNTIMGVPMENLGLDDLLKKQPVRKADREASQNVAPAPAAAPAPPAPGTDNSVDPILDAIEAGTGDLDALRATGDAGAARLAIRLPGPLAPKNWRLDSIPPPSQHGPLLRAAVGLGLPMIPFVRAMLGDPEPERRFYGALLFQEIRDPDSIPALIELAFDPAQDVRMVSTRVVETYGREPAMVDALRGLRERLATPDPETCVHAARALGTLRDPGAIADLIPRLGHAQKIVRLAALEALCSITARRGGQDPAAWSAWYEANAHRHRVEWIIDSLGSPDRAIRAWTETELMRVTGKRMAVSAANEGTQAEAVQSWRTWWQSEGRTIFGAA